MLHGLTSNKNIIYNLPISHSYHVILLSTRLIICLLDGLIFKICMVCTSFKKFKSLKYTFNKISKLYL